MNPPESVSYALMLGIKLKKSRRDVQKWRLFNIARPVMFSDLLKGNLALKATNKKMEPHSPLNRLDYQCYKNQIHTSYLRKLLLWGQKSIWQVILTLREKY